MGITPLLLPHTHTCRLPAQAVLPLLLPPHLPQQAMLAAGPWLSAVAGGWGREGAAGGARLLLGGTLTLKGPPPVDTPVVCSALLFYHLKLRIQIPMLSMTWITLVKFASEQVQRTVLPSSSSSPPVQT